MELNHAATLAADMINKYTVTIQSLSQELKEARAAHNETKGELVRTQSELQQEAEQRKRHEQKIKELQGLPGIRNWVAKGEARAKTPSGIPSPSGTKSAGTGIPSPAQGKRRGGAK
jgi:septal ring factor EnvC (AmiA/AmiB activator)